MVLGTGLMVDQQRLLCTSLIVSLKEVVISSVFLTRSLKDPAGMSNNIKENFLVSIIRHSCMLVRFPGGGQN